MNILHKTLFCLAFAVATSSHAAQEEDADFAVAPDALSAHVLKAAPNFPINCIFHNKKFYVVSNNILMTVRAQLIAQGKYQPHLKERQEQGLPPLYSPKILKKVGWVGDDYGYIPRRNLKKIKEDALEQAQL